MKLSAEGKELIVQINEIILSDAKNDLEDFDLFIKRVKHSDSLDLSISYRVDEFLVFYLKEEGELLAKYELLPTRFDLRLPHGVSCKIWFTSDKAVEFLKLLNELLMDMIGVSSVRDIIGVEVISLQSVNDWVNSFWKGQKHGFISRAFKNRGA